jgi:hypothetical protein
MPDTITAPQFPPVARPSYTLLTEEDKAQGFRDLLQTTVLGETWNGSEVSVDSIEIFVPQCKEVESNRIRFTEVLPGEHMFSDWTGNTDPNTVELISLMASTLLLQELVNAGSSFQFVAAPGTEREQRYRVARGGKLQKIGFGSSYSPFALAKPSRVKTSSHDAPVITTKRHGHTVITWTDDNWEPTGETSKAKYVDLYRDSVLDLADIFYALNSLDSETFALYGQVCGVCGVCGRGLADAASIKRGVGPDCWKRLQEVRRNG